MKHLQHILIVDNDLANFARMVQAFSSLECNVVTAGQEAEALTVLTRLAGPHGFSDIIVTCGPISAHVFVQSGGFLPRNGRDSQGREEILHISSRYISCLNRHMARLLQSL